MTHRSWSWYGQALCRDHPTDLFFPDDQHGTDKRRIEDAAKSVCKKCPVRIACAEHALLTPEHYGIWGAMTPRERDRFRHHVHGSNARRQTSVPTLDATAPKRRHPSPAKALAQHRSIPTPLSDQPPS